MLSSARDVVAVAAALGGPAYGGPLSTRERNLVQRLGTRTTHVQEFAEAIRAGLDPLGDAICSMRPVTVRRKQGAFYTPRPIIRAMVEWALAHDPVRFVDPGCGSGRFAAEAIRKDPSLEVVAIDVDPLATLACRASLAVLGAKNARVVNADYANLRLEPTKGRTVFVGNPPYVRHHDLSYKQKTWAKEAAKRLGFSISGLAGLHVHFFLAAFLQARPGDVGCFITSAEWLDVGYGKVLREALLNGMGGVSLHLLDREALTFEDAMTTAAITCFEVGRSAAFLRVRHVRSAKELGDLSRGRAVPASRIMRASRWTPLFFPRQSPKAGASFIALGEIVRVSRGVATGANRFFVLKRESARERDLLRYAVPVLTRARDVLNAGGTVGRETTQWMLFAPPREVDLKAREHGALCRYLAEGKRLGVTEAYLCRHRTPWWYLDAKRPPVVATYMTRQGPAFALNPEGLAIVNVLHGLFPKIPLDEEQLLGLVCYLNAHRGQFRGAGRTYQGGLEKFEPREMEALPIPPLDQLRSYALT